MAEGPLVPLLPRSAPTLQDDADGAVSSTCVLVFFSASFVVVVVAVGGGGGAVLLLLLLLLLLPFQLFSDSAAAFVRGRVGAGADCIDDATFLHPFFHSLFHSSPHS